MSKYQTFGKRLLAGIIDAILLVVVSFGLDTMFDITIWNDWFISQWLNVVITFGYPIFFIGKYGQTPGKMAMGVKVYSLDERSLIGYKRAFFRESIPLILSVIILILFCLNIPYNVKKSISVAGDWIAIVWFVLELVSMLTNPKRRAIHDFLASSVVVDVDMHNREINALAKEPAA